MAETIAIPDTKKKNGSSQSQSWCLVASEKYASEITRSRQQVAPLTKRDRLVSSRIRYLLPRRQPQQPMVVMLAAVVLATGHILIQPIQAPFHAFRLDSCVPQVHGHV